MGKIATISGEVDKFIREHPDIMKLLMDGNASISMIEDLVEVIYQTGRRDGIRMCIAQTEGDIHGHDTNKPKPDAGGST